MAEKPVIWLGSSLDDLRAFPDDARRSAGHELHLVQMGQEPSDWKSMSTVGPGVMELRIHTKLEHRVFYVAKLWSTRFRRRLGKQRNKTLIWPSAVSVR